MKSKNFFRKATNRKAVICSVELPSILLLLAALATPAQFNYSTRNGAITITHYTGSGNSVSIPDTINGLPPRMERMRPRILSFFSGT